MKYKILKDGEVINAIVAEPDFVEGYCEANGYTYEALAAWDAAHPETPAEGQETALTEAEMAAAIQEGVGSV